MPTTLAALILLLPAVAALWAPTASAGLRRGRVPPRTTMSGGGWSTVDAASWEIVDVEEKEEEEYPATLLARAWEEHEVLGSAPALPFSPDADALSHLVARGVTRPPELTSGAKPAPSGW